jgi:hypothetical protein
MLKKTALFAILGAGLGASGVGACAAFDASAGGTSGDYGGASGSTVGTGDGDASVDVAPDGERPTGPITYAALCGEGACDPNESGCIPPAPNGDTGGGGAGPGTSGSGGAEGSACHVGSVRGVPVPMCTPAGPGNVQSPCMSDLDCASGLGCVESGVDPLSPAGFCQPYCCASLEACPASTYCAPKAHFEEPSLQIPVCEPVTPCPLLIEGACGEALTCTVVRADGTTSCVPTGDGKLCDACPCAAGFVCSQSTGTCQQLCHTDGVGECGGTTGTCQGGTNLPSGIGICIGGDADCSN